MAQQFQVVDVKDDYFLIKRYGNLADKRLQFSVKIVKIVKNAKEVKKSGPKEIVDIQTEA